MKLFIHHYVIGTLVISILSVSMFLYAGWLLCIPCSEFPYQKPFIVKEGDTIKVVSTELQDEGYIRSGFLFRLIVSLREHDRKIQVGQYSFPEGSSLLDVVSIFISKGPQKPLASITVPEGSTESDIATIIHTSVPTVTTSDVLTAIHDQSAYGFLFPDTYSLNGTESAHDIVRRMMNLFALKYNEAFKATTTTTMMVSDSTIRDQVSLAAILEGEAKTQEDMKIVSGILHKRLSMGMPLQVDVAKETYTQKGLPNPPISNPGLVALQAAVYPTDTAYLYYLTGKDGIMHYAKTYEEHKANIKKYL